MTNLFMFLIANGKIEPSTVLLLLLFPVIACLVAFSRQVVGIKMFGVYAPIITAYAFLGTGLLPGIIIATIIYLTSLLLRFTSKRLHLHYLPRVALMMSIVSIVILILLPASIYIPFMSTFSLSGLSIILLVALCDIYLTSEIQDGYKAASRLFIETVLVSACIFIIVSWGAFQNLLIQHPEIILLFIILTILIGRWKGLRLIEVYRFRSVIRQKAKEYGEHS